MTNSANQAITAPDLNRSHYGPLAGPGIFIFIFMLSGLSGLIYESIWSHYLKLFLGHAAYAQSLVLAIFMGGMAAGSWFAARYSARWKNVLLGYAAAEALIGLSALLFHNFFHNFMEASFTSIIPQLGSAAAVHTFKWTLASLLILPQSILLGMTFPLMCAGILRRQQENSGRTIATLYFANSFGGAIGVLLSGFVLIKHVGLPGTIMLAGIVNILLAVIVWLLVRQSAAAKTPAKRPPSDSAQSSVWFRVILAASLITGAASFIYEIAWIRMLSMVLSSSTHAFELMLSAFIFGLAFGGLWIRRRIGHIPDQVRYVAWVQLAMGFFALLSLQVYGITFEFMQLALKSLTRTDSAYVVFNTVSHGLAFAVMLPATFCAGMTLPLMTNALLQKGYGERSIGSIYAANTIGAITGVLLSVHILIALVGVKGLMVIGGILDIGLGLYLLRLTAYKENNRAFYGAVAAGTATVMLFISTVHLDPARMASGVYRTGEASLQAGSRIMFHRDGKTATITLYEQPNGSRVISTNGKPDAAIQMASNNATADEITMVLAGSLPLAYHPAATRVANIGMGSGLTTHTLLGSSGIERVDTIEIEQAMVDGAMHFMPHVSRAYQDTRSNIYIEDARTFFSTNGKTYDIIISEPSNPWVSGVANLFTDEFYHGVTRYLAPNGLFVQWLQIYEIDTALVASVLRALSGRFSDYVVYNTDSANILILAKQEGKLGAPDTSLLKDNVIKASLQRVAVNTADDLHVRYIGNKATLDPFLLNFGTPKNSDYFPYLDQHAVRSRFLGENAQRLNNLVMAPLPILEMLEPDRQEIIAGNVTANIYFSRTARIGKALRLRDMLVHGIQSGSNKDIEVSGAQLESVLLVRSLLEQCTVNDNTQLWLKHLVRVAANTIPQLSPAEAMPAWHAIREMSCYVSLDDNLRQWIGLLEGISGRDGAIMASLASKLLERKENTLNREVHGYLLTAAMLGYMHNNDSLAALHLWETHAPRVLRGNPPGDFLKVIYLAATRDRGSVVAYGESTVTK